MEKLQFFTEELLNLLWFIMEYRLNYYTILYLNEPFACLKYLMPHGLHVIFLINAFVFELVLQMHPPSCFIICLTICNVMSSSKFRYPAVIWFQPSKHIMAIPKKFNRKLRFLFLYYYYYFEFNNVLRNQDHSDVWICFLLVIDI